MLEVLFKNVIIQTVIFSTTPLVIHLLKQHISYKNQNGNNEKTQKFKYFKQYCYIILKLK